MSSTSALTNCAASKPSTVSASNPLPAPSSAVVRILLPSIVVFDKPENSLPELEITRRSPPLY